VLANINLKSQMVCWYRCR